MKLQKSNQSSNRQRASERRVNESDISFESLNPSKSSEEMPKVR